MNVAPSDNAFDIDIVADVGCPCIDASSIFQNLDRQCKLPTKHNRGVRANTQTCYPLQYGSSVCDTHDKHTDPYCYNNSLSSPPEYCNESWCYVDKEKCISSNNIVVRSKFFSDADLFYSYTTCNSTETHFFNSTATSAFNGIHMKATIPGIVKPSHYKLNQSDGLADFSGSEYYNNSIPYIGSLIDYVNSIVDYAGTDMIGGITYTHRSRGSDRYFPESAFTAAVNDVSLGISDIAISTFWVTANRARLTTFTTTIQMDRAILVVPRPSIDKSLLHQTEKLLSPFTPELWFLLLTTIFVSAVLGVWFTRPSYRKNNAWIQFRNANWNSSSFRRRIFLLSRLILDGFLEKGMFFFGGAVEQDGGASLPHKFLMFGFSFLIFIAVSAYVAELAAFLTASDVGGYIDSIDKAISSGTKICANTVLQEELLAAWPDANDNFVFINNDIGSTGIYEDLKSYKNGICQAIIISRSETSYYNDKICELGLFYTDAIVLEIPIAFPINKDLAAGFSALIYDHSLEKKKSFFEFEDDYTDDFKCDPYTVIADNSKDNDENERITVSNMAFAFLFYLTCVIAAVILQLFGKYSKTADKFIARSSRLHTNYISERKMNVEDDDDVKPPKQLYDSSTEKKVTFYNIENMNTTSDWQGDDFEENYNTSIRTTTTAENYSQQKFKTTSNGNTNKTDQNHMNEVSFTNTQLNDVNKDYDTALLQNLVRALEKEYINHHKEHTC